MLDNWNTVVHIEEFFVFSEPNFMVISLDLVLAV